MPGPGEDRGSTVDDSRSAQSLPRAEAAGAYLFRLLECEDPAAMGARSSLRNVDAVTIGRGARGGEQKQRELILRAPDRFLSSAHARLARNEDGWLLEDATSKNGTRFEGVRISRRLLEDGDIFEAGRTFFLFRASLPPASGPAHVEASALRPSAPGLLTLQPQLEAAFERIAAIARSKLPVLIIGETGTGKERTAAAAHQLSERTGPLQAVNCAAIAPALLESELFGHKKGAFSGATEDKPGLLRASDRGTLFLDELGELPLPAQAALLRALQQSEVVPVGGTQPVKIDLRLVAATHRDLASMVASGTFRADLLGRLQGFVLRLPPLRERREDLGLLIAHVLREHAANPEKLKLSPEAARLLLTHAWPLNVRELDQALAAALLLAKDAPLEPAHLPESLQEPHSPTPSAAPMASLSGAELQLRAELVQLLETHGGNLSAVARAMGKHRTQVRRWVARFGLAAV